MPAARWNATVVDSPGSEPYAVVGDLVVAVRTPRSRDFVTVEVAPSAQCAPSPERRSDVLLSSKPLPCFPAPWQGEVHLGRTVSINVAGGYYRLTLARLSELHEGLPWIACDFAVERD